MIWASGLRPMSTESDQWTYRVSDVNLLPVVFHWRNIHWTRDVSMATSQRHVFNAHVTDATDATDSVDIGLYSSLYCLLNKKMEEKTDL